MPVLTVPLLVVVVDARVLVVEKKPEARLETVPLLVVGVPVVVDKIQVYVEPGFGWRTLDLLRYETFGMG